MKKFLLFGGMLLLPFLIQAQNVFSGEPIQWVGRPNGYNTTPYNSDYRTTGYRKVSTTISNPSDGRGQWATTINVQSSGGNISPDNMPGGPGAGWLLISGPSGNRFQNKWNFSGVGQAGLNSINNITRQGGGEDMGLNMGTVGFYTFVMRDAGYNNSEVYIGYTSAAPVTVSLSGQSFSNGQPRISISTNNTPSANENIYVRYRIGTNNFTTNTSLVQATGSGTSWTATLPTQNCNTTVFYYIFTSTRNLSELNGDSDQNRSLATLRYDDNFGSNYSFSISQSSAAILSGDATICSGESSALQVSITGGLSPYTLVYSDGTTNFTVNDYVSGSDINVSPTSTSTFSIVSVTGANGCVGIGNSGTALLTVNENITYYADSDGDGFGNDAVTTLACIQPIGFVAVGGDCDDTNDTIFPGATEICFDGILQNCNGELNDGCPAVLTQIRPYFCGSTLQNVNSSILADVPTALPLGAAVTEYRYEITNLSNNAVSVVEKTIAMVRISETNIAGFGTAYSIRVAVRINQEWQDYGTPCSIFTPSIPTTTVSTLCGQILPTIQSSIFATPVTSALGYEFEVNRIEGGIAVQTTSIERAVNNFKITLLSGIDYVYSTEYQVRVRVKAEVNGVEAWSGYGAVCSVFTPEAPEAAIEGCGGEAGITPAALSTPIYTSPIAGATLYRFTLTDDNGYSQVYTTPSRFFRLSNFNALSPLTPGGQYSVTVETEIYGNFYAGKDCNILVPGGMVIRPNAVVKEVEPIKGVPTEFNAIAYPNPFATSFSVDVRTSNTETVSLTVYDMAGRLLEVKELNASEVANYQFGDRFPSGVYNMIVTQGESTRTVRVVKQ